jgi:RimJ/RimL family protein N-acetyltransferase
MLPQTDRLILRDLVEDDWIAMHAYLNDPRFLACPQASPMPELSIHSFIWQWIPMEDEPRGCFLLAVVLADKGLLVGACGITRAGRDKGKKVGWVGYEIAPWHWGKGFATEAARAVIDFGFEELGLDRISGDTLAINKASVRVMRKLGMWRDTRRNTGRWAVYSIRRDEWLDRA